MTRAVALVVLVACGSKSDPGTGSGSGAVLVAGSGSAPAKEQVTPQKFFQRGVPTYVVGTAGDDHSDRAISGQAELIRSLLTPKAQKLFDIDVAGKAVSAWPANPVVYGGAHVNAAIAAIAGDLPFTITANKLVIGEHTLEGDYALITVVPARAGKYPEFLLYAGTGTPGIAEINSPSVNRVEAPIVIADAFGAFMVGTWQVGPDGIAKPKLGKPGRRVNWRETTADIAGAAVKFRLFDGAPVDADAPAIAAATKGIERAIKKLAPDRPIGLTVYIHPDQRSKKSLTGNDGHGHVIAFARTLHVFANPDLENLVAHEATHIITPQIWAPPGSPLFGEGVAVWAAGGYAGQPLASFKGKLKSVPVRELLGWKFRSLPEAEAYPIGGTLIDVLVAKHGLAKVREHFYPATSATWDEACKQAGTTAADVEAALTAASK